MREQNQLADQFEVRRRRLLEIARSEHASQNQMNRANRALLDLTRQREVAEGRLAQRQANRAQQAQAEASQRAANAELDVLDRQARTGSRKAAIEAQVLRVRQQATAQAANLQRLAQNELLTAEQRARIQQRIVQLRALETREIAMARKGQLGMLAGQNQLGAMMAAGMITGAAGAPMAGMGLVGLGAAGLSPGAIGATMGAAAIVGMGAASIREAAQFEASMSRVQAVLGATRSQMAGMREEALRLGRTTVFTADQAAEGMARLSLAGLNMAQTQRAIEPTLQLAVAGELDIAESARILTQLMSGMNLTADQLTETVDTMVKAFTSANTDLRELGQAMSFVGPVAMLTDQSLQDVTASIQALSNAGMAGERAGTGLRQILLTLLAPTKQAEDLLNKLNISIRGVGNSVLPIEDIIGQFEDRLKGLGSAEVGSAIGQIFDNRAAASFIALLKQGRDGLAELRQGLEGADGSAARFSDTLTDNLQGAITKLRSAWSGLLIDLGTAPQNAMQQYVADIAGGVNVLGDLAAGRGLAPREQIKVENGRLGQLQAERQRLRVESAQARRLIDARMGAGHENPGTGGLYETIVANERRLAELQTQIAREEAKAGEAVAVAREKREREAVGGVVNSLLSDSQSRERMSFLDVEVSQRDRIVEAIRGEVEMIERLNAMKEKETRLTDAQRASLDEGVAERQKRIAEGERRLAELQERADRRGEAAVFEADRAATARRAEKGSVPAIRRLAEMQAQSAIDSQIRALTEALADPAISEDRRTDVTGRLTRLQDQRGGLIADAGRVAVEGAQERNQAEDQRRQDSIRRRQITLLEEQAKLGDEDKQREAEKLKIRERFLGIEREIRDTLRDERLTAADRESLIEQLATLAELRKEAEAAAGKAIGPKNVGRGDFIEVQDISRFRFREDGKADPERVAQKTREAQDRKLASIDRNMTTMVDSLNELINRPSNVSVLGVGAA